MKEKIKNNPILYKIFLPIISFMRRIRGIYFEMLLFYIGVLGRKIHFPYYYKKYKKIKKYKNIYKGRRAFVVATGPSLKIEDLEKINLEITFSVNGIFKMFDQTEWRPTYYVLDDYYLYDNYIKSGYNVEFDDFAKENSFVSSQLFKRIRNHKKYKSIIEIPFFYFDHWFTNNSTKFRYTKNLMFGYYDAYTVTNFAMSIAVYMGITDIYLVGVDNTYSEGIIHYGDKKVSEITYKQAISMENAQLHGYEMMKRELKKWDVNVYNATRGGKLEVFPRANLDALFVEK